MATTDEIKKVRRQIGDSVKADSDIQTANGTDRQFALRYNNLFDQIVQVNGAEITTGFTHESDAGLITFTTAPAADSVIKVSYKYAAFTDTEIGEMIDATNVPSATVDLLKELLANAARLYNYQQGPTRADKNQIFQNLKDLLNIYQGEANDYNSAGGLTVGKRTNENYRPLHVEVLADFSRDDEVVYGR